MENRRLFAAVSLSALILVVWNYLFPPAPPSTTPVDHGAPRESATETAGTEQSFEQELDGKVDREEETSMGRELFSGHEEIVGGMEERVVLENRRLRLEFNTRGAQLVSLRLKDQAGQEEEDSLELIRGRGSDPFPFSLVVDGARSHRLNGALFDYDVEQQEAHASSSIRLRHKSEKGSAEKIFYLGTDSVLSAEIAVADRRQWSVVVGPGLRNFTEKELQSRFIERSVGYLRSGDLETIAARKQEADQVVGGAGLRWVSLEDNFFLGAVLPESGIRDVTIRPVLQRLEAEAGSPRFLPVESKSESAVTEQMLLVGASGERMQFKAFFGAKRYSELASMPYGLEATVRWGSFGFLAKPLYFALEWIYRNIVANYGWAIVLVTCLIKLLFFPLTYKSQESMSRMQELNPKVQAIRNKYRSKLKDKSGRPNPEASRQMNEEVMQVYKKAGVNPAAGCLPILLQAPVFFAFFRLLSTAVELRNAAWLGWITDLSVADPYYILPLVMGGTSVALQRMMPAAPDPMQRRMMQMLPIMFTVFAFQFPSGLLLYWITNNLLSMVQQALTVRLKSAQASA